MAIEKILNTRIQLKYDTLANWNASTFKLKAGELAIVKVGEMKDGSTHENAQYPVLFKVGTGDHTFSQLPYASALAADVYAWAKASDVVLAGKTIQFKNGDTVVKSIELNYITENEAKTLIATALADYSTTEQMNAAIKNEADRAKAAEAKIATFGEDDKLNGGALFTEVNSLDGRIDTLEGHVGDSTKGLLKDVADLKTAVGAGGSVDSKIESAIAGLDAEQSQTAGADGLALSITEVDGKITAISGSIAANTYDKYGSAAAAQSAAEATAAADATTKADNALAAAKTYAEEKATAAETAAKSHAEVKATEAKEAAEKTASDALTAARTEISAKIDADVKAEADRAKGVEAGLQSAINAINGNDGILKQAKDYVDGEIDKVEATIEDVIDGTTPVAKATKADDADKLGGVAAADYATKAYADQAETDAITAAKEYTDSVKDAILGDGIKDTFDTLVEIQNWIEGDGVNVTELTQAIANEAALREAADTQLGKDIAAEASAREAAVSAEASRAKGEEARIEGLVTTEKSRAEDAEKAIQDQIDALGIANGKVAKADRADSAATADVANSLSDSAKAEVKAVKVDNATRADSAAVADKASGLDDAGVAAVKDIKVDNATHADAASKVDNIFTVVLRTGQTVVYDGSTEQGINLSNMAFVSEVQEINKGLVDIREFDRLLITESDHLAKNVPIDVTSGDDYPHAGIAIENIKTYVDDQVQAAKDHADGLADNYATAAQGAKADSAVQSVKILGETLTDGGELTVDEAKTALGLGSAAYTEASAYATAAQGTKADSALQSISAGTGLKVSAKADNSQTIDIDESVVFVFNCGSASTFID